MTQDRSANFKTFYYTVYHKNRSLTNDTRERLSDGRSSFGPFGYGTHDKIHLIVSGVNLLQSLQILQTSKINASIQIL